MYFSIKLDGFLFVVGNAILYETYKMWNLKNEQVTRLAEILPEVTKYKLLAH